MTSGKPSSQDPTSDPEQASRRLHTLLNTVYPPRHTERLEVLRIQWKEMGKSPKERDQLAEDYLSEARQQHREQVQTTGY